MNLATLMRGSKTAAKIEAEMIDAQLAARRRLVEEIETLRTSTDGKIQGLLRAAEASSAKCVAAEATLKLAQATDWAARDALNSFDMGLRLGVARLEGELRRTAPARIDEAIQAWRAAWERARTIFSPAYGRNAPATVEDAASAARIGDRCGALLEATKQGEELKLLALSADELEERIAAIEAGIPPAFG